MARLHGRFCSLRLPKAEPGVLRRLVDDPDAMAQVARMALRLCHFDPETGEDRHRAPQAREDCEAACYDCLMSYGNQRFHQLLDRQLIREFLLDCTHAQVQSSPAAIPRSAQLEQLRRVAGSDLERTWLDFLETRRLRLPGRAQSLIESCQTRPDFLYDGDYGVAVYIDGPIHRYPERHARDVAQTAAMEDQGLLRDSLWCRGRLGGENRELSPCLWQGAAIMSYAVGSLVRARGREWVVLPETTEDLLMVRPLGGTEDEVTGIYLPLEGAGVTRHASSFRTPPTPATTARADCSAMLSGSGFGQVRVRSAPLGIWASSPAPTNWCPCSWRSSSTRCASSLPTMWASGRPSRLG